MLNKTVIQGRVVRDVELRTTTGGKSVASFTIAWSEKYKETETKLFLQCVAWGQQGEFIQRYMGAKGTELIVEGRLSSRSWEDKNGNKRETVELTVDKAHFCGKKADSGQSYGGTQPVNVQANDYDQLADDDQVPF